MVWNEDLLKKISRTQESFIACKNLVEKIHHNHLIHLTSETVQEIRELKEEVNEWSERQQLYISGMLRQILRHPLFRWGVGTTARSLILLFCQVRGCVKEGALWFLTPTDYPQLKISFLSYELCGDCRSLWSFSEKAYEAIGCKERESFLTKVMSKINFSVVENVLKNKEWKEWNTEHLRLIEMAWFEIFWIWESMGYGEYNPKIKKIHQLYSEIAHHNSSRLSDMSEEEKEIKPYLIEECRIFYPLSASQLTKLINLLEPTPNKRIC